MYRKNLLLIVIDCLRADIAYDIALRGKLSFIRWLIDNGISFRNNFATAGVTTPSFASILTGLYPAKHGIKQHSGQKLYSWIVTLPQILKNKGYYTRAEVTGPLIPEVGLNKGFMVYNYRDRNVTVYTEWWDYFLKSLSEMPQPWFVLLHLWELHIPRYLPSSVRGNPVSMTRYVKALKYLNEKISDLLNFVDLNKTAIILLGDHGEYFPENYLRAFSAFMKYYSKKGVRKIAKGPLSFLNKLVKHTLVDIGHGFSVQDPMMKVPLIIYDPNIGDAGSSFDYITSNVDILPTALSLLNIKYKLSYALDGVDLIDVLKSRKKPHVFVILEAVGFSPRERDYIVAIRTERYKYVTWPYRQPVKEVLFDLEKDPKERLNVLHEHPELVQVLREYLFDNYLGAAKKRWRYVLKIKSSLRDKS